MLMIQLAVSRCFHEQCIRLYTPSYTLNSDRLICSRRKMVLILGCMLSVIQVFGLRTLGESNMIANSHRELDSESVDHLVSTFSSDPSLIAFAQLCCDKSWNNR